MTRARTAKERVLRKWRKAIAWQTPIRKKWIVSSPDWMGRDIGQGHTANAAWADAARKL